MVANTSKMAYEQLVSSGKEMTQRARILGALVKHPDGLTRRGLSFVTRLELGAVAGRVNSLLADGLVDDSEETQCHTTHKTVKLIKPVTGVQGQLF